MYFSRLAWRKPIAGRIHFPSAFTLEGGGRTTDGFTLCWIRHFSCSHPIKPTYCQLKTRDKRHQSSAHYMRQTEPFYRINVLI